jgi:hypothetical protein
MTNEEFARAGASEKRDFLSHNTGHIIRALRAQVEQPEKFMCYIHDAQTWMRFLELDDVTLGKVMSVATKDYFEGLGLKGPRSNSGTTITPLFTVGLRLLKEELGEDAVVASGFEAGFRGIKNTMLVKTRFIAIMDDLLHGVLCEVVRRAEL